MRVGLGTSAVRRAWSIGDAVDVSGAHSGGSSANTRLQTIAASRWETTLAKAPNPASTPDHIKRFIISFSISRSLITVAVSLPDAIA